MLDLLDGPSDARHHLILAHGAGEGPDSPFLTHMARALAAGGVGVTRFAFPYMLEAARSGRRRPPDRKRVLRAAWQEAIRAALARGGNPPGLIIGGKSMGGRIASLIADEVGPAGLICLGYPFHPPGRPERLRTAHLAALRTPTLICQGTRDPFGRPEEVADYALSPTFGVRRGHPTSLEAILTRIDPGVDGPACAPGRPRAPRPAGLLDRGSGAAPCRSSDPAL